MTSPFQQTNSFFAEMAMSFLSGKSNKNINISTIVNTVERKTKQNKRPKKFENTTCFGSFNVLGLTSSTKQESLMRDFAKYKLDTFVRNQNKK